MSEETATLARLTIEGCPTTRVILKVAPDARQVTFYDVSIGHNFHDHYPTHHYLRVE